MLSRAFHHVADLALRQIEMSQLPNNGGFAQFEIAREFLFVFLIFECLIEPFLTIDLLWPRFHLRLQSQFALLSLGCEDDHALSWLRAQDVVVVIHLPNVLARWPEAVQRNYLITWL